MESGARDIPTVSVVIPLFDGERYIGATLDAVLAQTYPHFEVVVVDDGSHDRGAEIVADRTADARVTLIAGSHSGIAATRNTGLSATHAASRYVMFLDQDDLVAPDLLEGLVAALEARSDAVAAFAIARTIGDDGSSLGDPSFTDLMRHRTAWRDNRMVPTAPEDDVRWPDLFIANAIYPPSTALLRRAAVIDEGGLDASLEVADDWDLMLRLLRHGPIICWNAVKVGYRRHQTNASSNETRNVRETRAVWANTYHSPRLSRTERRTLHRFWRAHQRRTSARKARDAVGLIRRGRIGDGIARFSDAAAHAVIPWPLRAWRTGSPGIGSLTR